MAVVGPETWTVDGKRYQIDSTYYLALPEGFQYTMEIPWKFANSQPMNDQSALIIALPLMEYALKNNVYKRMRFSKVGVGNVEADRIAVILVERKGQEDRVYRIALSIPEIRARTESAPIK